LQRKVTPGSLSLKAKVALFWLVALGGPAVMDGAGGGVVSIVQVKEVEGPTLPAVSLASALNVCDPGASGPA
jgi:hypothetical protein